MNETLSEAKRLYDLGFAIHWLHKKSKRPVNSGWTTGPREKGSVLKAAYREGMNIGVRTGSPSKVENGYLAVVDVDVKSSDERHRKEAVAAAMKVLAGARPPCVMSGRGNGSRHYYVVTAKPFKTWDPATSEEEIKVHMPSKKASKRELETLSVKELADGIRLSPAWGVSLYSDGRQVVLPPSIHPDSGEPYSWARQIAGPLPLVVFPDNEDVQTQHDRPASSEANTKEPKVPFEFTPDKIEIEWLPISTKIKNAIQTGDGVTDRSAFLLPAATALLKAGLERDEILSVLTDKATYLGQCAYDHAKTASRRVAAHWVWRYTLKKVMSEKSGREVFTPVTDAEEKSLPADAVAEQSESFKRERNWSQDLKRGGQKGNGDPKPTLENTILVLTNEVGPDFVRLDEFAQREVYSCDTPWNGKKGEQIIDVDAPRIMHWLGKHWQFEPSKDTTFNALAVVATHNAHNPVVEALERLPKWDGVKRLDSWLPKYFGAKGHPEYLAQVFRKWIVAMVMRQYEPGSKFDWMPIFEGFQDMGKSAFGKILVGDEYFIDKLPHLEDKDAALALQGIWCCEMAELTQFNRNDLETIKAFIVRTTDKVRPPFGRKVMTSPRYCVFFGTTNKEKYLKDDTGNRRFKPVEVGALNFAQLKADRDQLFAEAKHLFEHFIETERTMELTGEAKIYWLSLQKEKMVEDDSSLMFELLKEFFQREKLKEKDEQFSVQKFKVHELFSGQGPLPKFKLDNRNMQFAAKALRALGAVKWKSDGTNFWKI